MASSRWVANASPLILLGKVGQIQLLGHLAETLVVPNAVMREVSAKPDGERTIQTLTALESVILVDDAVAPANILSWDLGPGETQVISHAVSHSADRVVIDDLEARRCAKAMGLAIIGTLGIVGRAKAAGLIGRAGPVVQRLRKTGIYASDDIVQRLLREVGESLIQDEALRKRYRS
jgi:predicted nucleic acid-binding protein